MKRIVLRPRFENLMETQNCLPSDDESNYEQTCLSSVNPEDVTAALAKVCSGSIKDVTQMFDTADEVDGSSLPNEVLILSIQLYMHVCNDTCVLGKHARRHSPW